MAWTGVMSRSCSSRLDGGGDPLIAAAATDVAAHGVVDLALRRVFVGSEQRSGLHDLAGLAIAALRDIQGAPSLLHRMVPLRIEAFDRDHRTAGDIAYSGDAGAARFAVDMNRASPAQRHATAVFSPGEAQFVPQIPEQRYRWITVERLRLSIHLQFDHRVSSM